MEKNKYKHMQHTATKAARPRSEEREPRLVASVGRRGNNDLRVRRPQFPFSLPPAERLCDLRLPGL